MRRLLLIILLIFMMSGLFANDYIKNIERDPLNEDILAELIYARLPDVFDQMSAREVKLGHRGDDHWNALVRQSNYAYLTCMYVYRRGEDIFDDWDAFVAVILEYTYVESDLMNRIVLGTFVDLKTVDILFHLDVDWEKVWESLDK